MKIVMYFVGVETDVLDANGKKVLLVYGERLTYAQAELLRDENPGTEIFKRTVHRDGYEVCKRVQSA